MSLYVTFGLMTLAAVFTVLLPLGRRRHAVAVSDADVYRAQLAEIDGARALGSVSAEEGEGLRAEVARRLIAAAQQPMPPVTSGDTRRRRVAALAAVLGIPLLAASVYAFHGNPVLPDRPRTARLAASGESETAKLIARVEGVLARRPDDGRGWDLLAPIYLRIGRPNDAATAYANAIRLVGSSPEREAGHGEALTIMANGVVTPQAKAAFQRTVDADPGNARARYFLALSKAQDGDRTGAVADLRAMLDKAPADAPWRAFIEGAVADLSGRTP